MVKGWRNNPAWVAYYEARAEARIEARVERMVREASIEQSLQRAKRVTEEAAAVARSRFGRSDVDNQRGRR